jgi:hypothetical protein
VRGGSDTARHLHLARQEPAVPRTKDHQVIRRWIEERGGRPARVRDTADLLRVSFGQRAQNLEELSWEAFFEIFDRHDLVFVFEVDPRTRFLKFVRARASRPGSQA